MNENKMRQHFVKMHLGISNMTMTEFAKSIGASRSNLSNVLAGRKRSAKIEAAVAKRVGLKVEDLWPASDEDPDSDHQS